MANGRAVDRQVLAETLLFGSSQGAIATKGSKLGPLVTGARRSRRAFDVNVGRLVVVAVDLNPQAEPLRERLCDPHPRNGQVENNLDRNRAFGCVAKEEVGGVPCVG